MTTQKTGCSIDMTPIMTPYNRIHTPTMVKPAKPYEDYPLTAHAGGKWCKKICRKIHYPGPWDDPEGAFDLYQRYVEDPHLGRITTIPKDHGNTVLVPSQGLRKQKPKKPHPDFPLFPHHNGQWAKKIRGKLRKHSSNPSGGSCAAGIIGLA